MCGQVSTRCLDAVIAELMMIRHQELFPYVVMLQETQTAPAASEQSRLREKARLVRVWYNIDRRYRCSDARNLDLYVPGLVYICN